MKFQKRFLFGFFSIYLWTCVVFVFFAPGCQSPNANEDGRSGTLHVIHAGSLTYPVKKIIEEFTREFPGARVLSEAWGSKAGARRVIDFETPCDIFMSADYRVIERMMIPDHTSWYIKFAANEMAIVFSEKSKLAERITSENWYNILLEEVVELARSNPDHDPCGVRAVFTSQLAGIIYDDPTLAEKLLEKSARNIRPKETDLIALLESGHVDYIFLYRSVAEQHGLQYIDLPDELNLKSSEMDDWYSQATVQTIGSTPGSTITEVGEAMVYGITIPHKTKKQELAEEFVAFVLDSERGLKILELLGQPGLIPSSTSTFDMVPNLLKKFALPGN